MTTDDQTLSIIKPDAVSEGHTGAIIKQIEEAGFALVAMKKIALTHEQAALFYRVHKERPFYGDLCRYMSSGPIVPMILKKQHAVEEFRRLIGATDPAKAKEGSVRARFGRSIEANAIHGSDSDENATIESAFFFSQLARFSS